MPFETRCPECSAKLRLDEAPGAGVPIECPKCGTLFAPPRAGARAAPKSVGSVSGGPPTAGKPSKVFQDEEDEVEERKPRKTGVKKPKSIAVKADVNAANKGIRRQVKKKRTSPAFLLGAIAFGFLGLLGLFMLMVYLSGRAGKVDEMLAYVPGEVNWVRGVNVAELAKYPGYSAEVTKFNTANVKAATDLVAKAAGHDPATFVDYLIIAKQRQDAGTTGTMYVVRTVQSMKLDALGAGLTGGTEAPVNGEKAYKFNASGPGILANATLILPTPRLMVVVVPGKLHGAMVAASANGKKGKAESFSGKLDATGRVVIKGSIWLLMRNTGYFKNYMEVSMKPVDTDFKKLLDLTKTSSSFGLWTSPGGSGVRLGAAFQCADKTVAADVVKYMKGGPLGKEDESEPTNQMKSAGLQFLTEKKTFGEFMQYAKFLQSRESFYVTSKLTGDNAKRVMEAFDNATIGSDEGGFSGGGPPGGGNNAGPPRAGLPGGIAMPGQ